MYRQFYYRIIQAELILVAKLLHEGSEKTVSLICLVMDPTLEIKKTPN